jgi:hypothetical protein
MSETAFLAKDLIRQHFILTDEILLITIFALCFSLECSLRLVSLLLLHLPLAET